MPTQVLPIADLAKAGVIMDLPSVSLPPNVFSDARNVRFRDGAIRKLEGEQEIIFNVNVASELIFTCYWPAPDLAPDNGYIVVVSRPTDPTILADTVHIFDTRTLAGSSATPVLSHTLSDPRTPDTFWQHTLFGGGNTLILNNRTSKPIYITDINQGFFDLPGWDSYLVDEQVTSFFYDTAFLTDEGTDLGQFVNLPDSLIVAQPWDSTVAYEIGHQVEYNGRLYTALQETTGVVPDSDTTAWLDDGLDGIGVPTLGDQNILVTVIPADTRISPFSIRVNDYLEPTVYANGVELWDANATYVNGAVVLFDNGGVITQFTATLPTPAQGEPPSTTTGQVPNANPSVWQDDGPAVPVSFPASVGYNAATGTTFITFAARELNANGTVRQQGVLANDSVTIRIQTEPEIQVRAGVIRTYGDLLIAGNLTEMDRTDVNRVVRNLPGVIRTSDVAAPGSIPANWNPFKTGVNTADEFTLSSTGIVQDMVELQGIMYIYTNESIHSVQQTGNNALPFNIRPVAHGWGAQTIDAVQEFDGKHIVIGTSDIFVFAGHPGSIQSIADMRVRRFFFQDLNPIYEQNLFTLLNRRRDEIWINYPGMDSTDGQCTRTLIWNYRNNTWTVRDQSNFWNGVMAPVQPDSTVDPNEFFPMFITTQTVRPDPTPEDPDRTVGNTDSIFVADATGKYTDHGNNGYNSYVERKRLALAPEFTTEMLLSVSMLTEGIAVSGGTNFAPTLEVRVVGTNTPAEEADLTDVTNTRIRKNPFDIASDYKVDIREHGRLLNYRITDEITDSTNRDDEWLIAGLQFDIGTGGTR